MKKVIILLIVVAGIWRQSYAQQSKIDSLIILLKTDKDDSSKVNHLLSAAWELNRTKMYEDSAMRLTTQAFDMLKLLQQLPDAWKKKSVRKCYFNFGTIYSNKSNYLKASEYFQNALKLDNELNDIQALAMDYSGISTVYYRLNNYPKGIEYGLKSLEAAEKAGDKLLEVDCLGMLGYLYTLSKNYPKALDYTERALKATIVLGERRQIAMNWSRMGKIYADKKEYQKALEHFDKGIKTFGEESNGVYSTYFNAANNCSIGTVYLKLGRFKEAENCLNKALILAEKIHTTDWMMNTYEALSQLYDTLGKPAPALFYYKKLIATKNEINGDELQKKLTEYEMNFAFEKKELALKAEQDKKEAIALEQKKRQQFFSYSITGILLIVIIFSSLLYKRFRITNKQKQIIEIKSKETEAQKLLIEEKHKEITDSINYAERIQRSFIATKELLDENLNDYFVFFKPKDIVSGDFYWASNLSNGNFVLATADSTGHGVPGAIMSLLNVTSLEKAIETHTQPSDILNATRQIIIERLKKDGSVEGGKDGMDASLTVYDFKNKKLFIAAANNPVWIMRKNESGVTEALEVKPDKMPIGKHDKDSISFTQQEVDLKSGDVIYTLTDGFPDQFGGESGKKFMTKRLREFIATNAHLSMVEQKQLLENTFANWVGNVEQVDDVCLIGVRV